MDKFYRLVLISLISGFGFTYSPGAYSQSAPSESGFACVAGGFFALSSTIDVACGSACAAALGGNRYDSGPTCTDVSTGNPSWPVTVSERRVCAVGNGYEQADNGGFCPDPPNGDEGDDDDGDGDICDEGEEKQADCNQPDSDVDGDGVPDSEDDDDGKCSSFNEGDLDCDGECGPIDDPASVDCADEEDRSCKAGEKGDYRYEFTETVTYIIPDEVICDKNCSMDRSNNGTPPTGFGGCYALFSGVTHEEIGLTCSFSKNGGECTSCVGPQCADPDTDECPVGLSDADGDGECEDVPNFCELDEHTNGTEDNVPDGKPDNLDTPACGESSEDCDIEIDPECGDRSVGAYECDAELPKCAGDTLECAIREEGYREACGTIVEGDAFDCEIEFACSGNSHECLISKFAKADFCRYSLTEEQTLDELSLDVFREGVDDGANWEGGEGVDGSVIDFSDFANSLDDSGYGFPRQCDLTNSVRAFGKNIDLSFIGACDFFLLLRWLIMLAASVTSFYILRGAF